MCRVSALGGLVRKRRRRRVVSPGVGPVFLKWKTEPENRPFALNGTAYAVYREPMRKAVRLSTVLNDSA
jgi:hypothetical protein